MENKLSITIYGIGALGTFFGSRLQAWADVTLVGHWPTQIEAGDSSGINPSSPCMAAAHTRS